MTFETLTVRSERAVLFVEIAAPPMNLLGPELVRDLVSLLQRAEADNTVQVVVFRSADPDYFISHIDVTRIKEYRQEAARLTGEASIALLFRHLSASRLVSIAQIEGRVRGDVGDPATAEAVVGQAISRFGRIDTLVNNAGIFIAKSFTDYTAEDLDTKIATNLAGFFHVTQRVAAEMLRQGSGHIVSITTSLVDHPNSSVPSALANLTKGGINSATKALAIEYATRGIRVNAVSPGIIKTPMHAPETHEFLAALHPMRRLGEIKDIVEAVLFLESAAFVTGEILHVDGGQSAGH